VSEFGIALPENSLAVASPFIDNEMAVLAVTPLTMQESVPIHVTWHSSRLKVPMPLHFTVGNF
jgi:hypothetical protein